MQKKYPFGKRGLASASPETIRRVTSMGGKAGGRGRPKRQEASEAYQSPKEPL